ncbi:MAG: Fe-S cluster assembly protein SufD [Nanoarchaeota archaeon]|nr:Fe-S cluster assembly protein SufD [Nanoarchaeota archaeon]
MKTLPKIMENEPSWLQELRQKAYASYSTLLLPKLRYGLGVGTTLNDLDLERVSGQEAPGAKVHCADPRIIILSLREALQEKEDMVKKALTAFPAEKNKLTAFHAAFVQQGALVIVPDNLEAEAPLFIEKNSAGDVIEQCMMSVGKNSSLTIIETAQSSQPEQPQLRSQAFTLNVGENSTVLYAQLQDLGKKTHGFSYQHASLQRDAQLHWCTATRGGTISQQQFSLSLEGEGAEGKTLALFSGDGHSVFDIAGEHLHNASRTTSNILAKATVEDSSKIIFRGLVQVAEGAAGCNGYQQEDALLLHEAAEADMVPNLEIRNNNVKCSHGSTIGRLDPEQLFYLTARGIPAEAAKNMLVEGFFEKAIGTIPDNHIQEQFRILLKRRGPK